jgi:phosphoribosyl 1,2-cyclic phosphodiesterase
MAGHRDIMVRFWGVRGSIPMPGAEYLKYGGNTACVEVRAADKILIIDAGSGLKPLGNKLLAEMPLEAHLFISHYHWDHIQGLPFHAPIYIPGNRYHLYGEARGRQGLRSILAGQMRYPYFPVEPEVFLAKINYHTIRAGDAIRLGPVRVATAALNHPQSATAYRVNYAGKAVVYCSDNEHNSKMLKQTAALIRGADLLIYDAAYTDDEYQGKTGAGAKVGWGHSTWSEAIRVARQLKVKHLVIFHHDAAHTDAVTDRLVKRARKDFPCLEAAREGTAFYL